MSIRLGTAVMGRSRREYRIRVVDGLQRLRPVSVLPFLRPNHSPNLPRPTARRCHSQETTPMSIDVVDADRVLRCFVGLAEGRERNPAFDQMATVVEPLQG